MKAGGKVSIDIADGSQSVTRSVNELLGDDKSIAPADVRLLDNGWLQLKRGGNTCGGVGSRRRRRAALMEIRSDLTHHSAV